MLNNHRSSHTLTSAAAPDHGSIGLRLGWMLGGPLAMMIALVAIAGSPRFTLGWSDLAFWTAVLLTGSFRALDVTRFHGETTHGMPATTADLKRYLAALAAVCTALWVAAQAVHV